MIHVSLLKQVASVLAGCFDALQPPLPTEEELQRHFLFPVPGSAGATPDRQPARPLIDRVPSGLMPL